MKHALLSIVCALGCASVQAQSVTDIYVDFGTSQFPTNGTVVETWNDLDQGQQGSPLALLDSQNQPTGAQLAVTPGRTFVGANSAGTTTPEPGSALAQFPPSATRDVMYGSVNRVELTLSSLDPNALYDFTFAASRMGVADNRSTDYFARGFNGAVATLNPSNNTTATAAVTGILPDSSGAIRISIQPSPDNDNDPTYYFYLGAMMIRATNSGQRPKILGFSPPLINVSRAAGKAPLSVPAMLDESTGAMLSASLAAIDQGTGLPPTWLTVPSNTTAGAPFSMTVDATSLALGRYHAVVTASANGYANTPLDVELQVRDPAVKNLLFYGNSYSQGNGTVSTMVRVLAEEAGEPTPNDVPQLVGGQTMQFHATDPAQVAAITNSLPYGEEWDYVVMQGHSLDATRLRNPTQFRQAAVAVVSNVRSHSPAARAVLFQTWARGPGHSVYSGTYANPLEMHNEIRGNYQLARSDIEAAFGAGTAERAAAGDAVALLAFDTTLYTSDLSHPTPPTSLLAGMAIFEALYGISVCDLQPDFSSSSNLVTHLARYGLAQNDWRDLSGIGERVALRRLRRYPGSDEDLLLRGAVAGPVTACPLKSTTTPATWRISMTSPIGVYGDLPAALLLSAFPTGNPPLPGPFAELHLDPGATFVIAQKPILGGALDIALPIPPVVSGWSALVQGVVLGPSTNQGNPLFTATDGHELQLR